MKIVLRAFALIHGLMALLFVCASLMLIVIATKTGWLAFASGLNLRTAQEIIEAVGLLAAAVVALQIGRPSPRKRWCAKLTSAARPACAASYRVHGGDPGGAGHRGTRGHVPRHPRRARAPSVRRGDRRPAGALLASWGVFVRLNRYAEELEPEAMAEAKKEDRKLKH